MTETTTDPTRSPAAARHPAHGDRASRLRRHARPGLCGRAALRPVLPVTGFGGTPTSRDRAPSTSGRARPSRCASTPTSSPGLHWTLRAGGSASVEAARRRDADGLLHASPTRSDRPHDRHRDVQRHAGHMGGYFNKIQCFCFTEHHAAAGREHGACRSCSSSIPTIDDEPRPEDADDDHAVLHLLPGQGLAKAAARSIKDADDSLKL